MKKFILSGGIAIIFVFYVLFQRGFFRGDGSNHQVIAPISLQNNAASNTQSNNQIPTSTSKQVATNPPITNPAPTPTPIPTPIPKPVGQYKDGSYTGSVADAYYGNVQVKAIISNGKISDVVFLDYPQDRNTSRNINSQAMPYLTQEAIVAQNANVDIISGATATSEAFIQSLSSALAQAKN